MGIQPVALNALYRLGLASGHYRRMEKREQRTENIELRHYSLSKTKKFWP